MRARKPAQIGETCPDWGVAIDAALSFLTSAIFFPARHLWSGSWSKMPASRVGKFSACQPAIAGSTLGKKQSQLASVGCQNELHPFLNRVYIQNGRFF